METSYYRAPEMWSSAVTFKNMVQMLAPSGGTKQSQRLTWGGVGGAGFTTASLSGRCLGLQALREPQCPVFPFNRISPVTCPQSPLLFLLCLLTEAVPSQLSWHMLWGAPQQQQPGGRGHRSPLELKDGSTGKGSVLSHVFLFSRLHVFYIS